MPAASPLRRASLLLLLLAFARPAYAQWPSTPAGGGLAVCTAANDQWYQQAIEDGRGGAFFVWRDDRAATPSNPSNYDIYAQHVDAAGFLLWGANGIAVCSDPASQDRPALCSDGAGGIFVVWSDPRFLSTDVWAQRIDSTGAPSWLANGVRVGRVDAAEDYAPLAVADGAGGFYCAWSSYAAATGTRVRAQHVAATGAYQWGTGGVALSGATGSQTVPALLADGTGAMVAAWVQAGAPRVVRAQRLNPAGLALWGANGIPVTDSTHAASQTHYVVPGVSGGARFIVHDTSVMPTPMFRDVDAGGATVRFEPLLPAASWAEIVTCASAGDSGATLCSTTSGDFESVQRVAADGTLQWGPHGRPVSPDSLTRTKYLTVTRDGAGGAYLIGVEFTETDWFELRMQHVRSGAVPAWPEDGITLATATDGDQLSPVLVPSAGGAIALWQDHRHYATAWRDLYAMRVDSTGALGLPLLDVTRPLSAGVSFAAPRPNPARAGSRVALEFSLPTASRVEVSLHDVAGRRVATLADGAFAAGTHVVRLDAGALTPGLYFARLRSPGADHTRRIAIVR